MNTHCLRALAAPALAFVFFCASLAPAQAACGATAACPYPPVLVAADESVGQKVDRVIDSVTEYVDDAAITTEIKSRLLRQKGVDVMAVSVETRFGVVSLSGRVASEAEKELVLANVRDVKGVRSVNDRLKVAGAAPGAGGGVGDYIDDAALTANVKGAMLGQKGLNSLDISVETKAGVVTLSGRVDNEAQIALAENTAGRINGVKGVVNKLSLK